MNETRPTRPGCGSGADSASRGAEEPERGRPRSRRHRAHRHWGPKERVLHTRVSEQLSEDIRNVAEELRVPVSNLVRNVLEEAFSVVETVTDNVGELIEEVVEEAEAARHRIRQRREATRARREPPPPPAPRAEFPEVMGWQSLLLNRAQGCADCEEPLERGEHAFVGVTGSGFAPIYLCEDCAEARRR